MFPAKHTFVILIRRRYARPDIMKCCMTDLGTSILGQSCKTPCKLSYRPRLQLENPSNVAQRRFMSVQPVSAQALFRATKTNVIA